MFPLMLKITITPLCLDGEEGEEDSQTVGGRVRPQWWWYCLNRQPLQSVDWVANAITSLQTKKVSLYETGLLAAPGALPCLLVSLYGALGAEEDVGVR